MLKKLRSDSDVVHHDSQLNEDFCKYLIVEEWGYRQTIKNVFKVLRGYCSEDINQPITNSTQYTTNLETSPTRFIFTYSGGQKLSLVRIRTMNKDNQSVLSGELELNWPSHGFECEPKVMFTR